MSEHEPDAAAPEPRGTLFDGPRMTTHEPPPPPPDIVVRQARRGGTPLALTLLLTAALGGAGYYAWSHPMPGALAQADSLLGQQLQSLTNRVDALEKPSPEAGEAAAGAAKKLDELSARVDALAAKQDQMQAEAAKAAEIASQQAPVAAGAAPPADHTAQEVPGLVAQQQASDATTIAHAQAGQGSPEQAAALTALDQRVAKLEAGHPAPASAPADAGAAPPADPAALAAIGERLTRLEQAAGQDQAAQKSQSADQSALAALSDRLAKLEQTAGQAQSQDAAAQQASQGNAAALAAVTDRLARLEQTAGQVQSADAATQKSQATDAADLAALDGRISKLEQNAGQAQGALTGATQDASRAIRMEAVAAALQAGQPLGEIPGAPPALSRFATVAPPTEAALRAAYPGVADQARAASQPDTARKSFIDRAFARLQQSVVVRQGDHVVVGDPAAGVLARAQDSVAAGDLKTAADTLGSLTGAAADAVKPWVAQVRALLDARAALASLARHG